MSQRFEVFYDGDCPLCVREIKMLRRLDRKQRIVFTDIAAETFQPDSVGISWESLMGEIHGRKLPDQSVVRGVEVFRQLYSAVGFAPLVWITRLPGISHLLELAYRWFAKNRLRLTGRCADRQCEIPRQEAS